MKHESFDGWSRLLGCGLLLLAITAPVLGQSAEPAMPLSRSYTTLTLVSKLQEYQTDGYEALSLTVGRLHPRGAFGRIMPRFELAGGVMSAPNRWADGFYGGVLVSLGYAFRQQLVELAPEYAIEPYLGVSAGAYGIHMREPVAAVGGRPGVPTIPNGARQSGPVGVGGVSIGVRAVPRAGESSRVVTTAELQRQFWTGNWRPRTYARVGLAFPTGSGRLLPNRGSAGWWDEDPPPMPHLESRNTTAELSRTDLPHHVFGLWGDSVAGSSAPALALDLWESVVARTDTLAPAPLRNELRTTPEARAALARDPRDAYLMHHLGTLYAARRQWDRAFQAWQHALEQALPANRWLAADIHADAAVALATLGAPDSALIRLDLAQSYDPQHRPALMNRGVLLEELGRTEEALSAYQAAMRALPSWPGGYENTAYALVRAGRREEALLHLARALELRGGIFGSATGSQQRWICADLALYEELSGTRWSGSLDCPSIPRPLASPRLLPRTSTR